MKKEIGLNEETLKKFLECVITLLDLIMDANCSINEVPIFMHDHVIMLRLFYSYHKAFTKNSFSFGTEVLSI